jgi:hypothetical protein
VFVKLAPFDVSQRAFVDETGMGVAEARFYAEIAGDVPVRLPHSWYAAHDDAGRYVMVLEDLKAAGARYPSSRDPDLPAFLEHDRCLRRAPCCILAEPTLRARW